MKIYTSTKQIINEFKEKYRDFEINIGASTVLLYKNGVFFSLVKPKYWRTGADGLVVIDYSGIGGGIENGESPYNCVLREMKEEIQVLGENVIWAKNIESTLFLEGMDKQKIQIGDSSEPQPMCIFNLTVPRKYDRPGQQSQSSLLLFVYLMKLNDNVIPKISKEEEIPGLVYVDGDFLDNFLEGVHVNMAESHSDLEFILHIREDYKEKFPPRFKLSPKFTPRTIQSSGLSYKDFVQLL